MLYDKNTPTHIISTNQTIELLKMLRKDYESGAKRDLFYYLEKFKEIVNNDE